MLEAAQHEHNSFATLTYTDASMPVDNSVSPRTLTLFIKRFRKNNPFKVRYFACGEYGDETHRPHYHLALFGYPNCLYGITRKRASCCANCQRVFDAWGNGNILLGTLEQSSAAYIAGYVTKKMTKADNPKLLGKLPEFARMSLRPGIGLGMMHELASTLMEHKLDTKMIDVPLSLQHGMKKWPLGRYLRRKLRTFIGRDPNAPPEILQQQKEELQTLRKTAWENKTALTSEILHQTLGKRIQMHARENRYKKKGSL